MQSLRLSQCPLVRITEIDFVAEVSPRALHETFPGLVLLNCVAVSTAPLLCTIIMTRAVPLFVSDLQDLTDLLSWTLLMRVP